MTGEIRRRPIGTRGGPELLRLLAAAEGWCMVRAGDAAPFAITLAEWLSLPVVG